MQPHSPNPPPSAAYLRNRYADLCALGTRHPSHVEQAEAVRETVTRARTHGRHGLSVGRVARTGTTAQY